MAHVLMKMGELRARLTEALDTVHMGDRVVIKRYGKPSAALVSLEDLQRIWDHAEAEITGPLKRDGTRLGDNDAGRAFYARRAHRRAQKRANGEDEKWNGFWVWVRSLQSSD